MSNIVIISGSPSQVSRSSAISAFINKLLLEAGQQVNQISVRDLPAEDLVFANFKSEEIKKHLEQVEKADAVIVVSPVYKASYPGGLKAFFDLIPEKGLANKVILPVVTGGSIAHLLSIEFAYNPLFSVLGSQEILKGVYLVDSEYAYSGNELTFFEPSTEERLKTAINSLKKSLSTGEPVLNS